MKKSILIAILAIVLIACGSRKTEKEQVKYEAKNESQTHTETDGVKVENKNLKVVESEDCLEITPIDTSKTMTIDGKEYKNANVKKKSKKKETEDKGVVKTEIAIREDKKAKADVKFTGNKKAVDKQAPVNYNYVVFWIFLLIVILFIPYIRRQLKRRKLEFDEIKQDATSTENKE